MTHIIPGPTWLGIHVSLPVRILSTANMREHPLTKWRREEIALRAIVPFLNRAAHQLPAEHWPLRVTLTRIGPKDLDAHDNLRHAFKFVVDAVAKVLGVDDADPRVRWGYDQRRAMPKELSTVRGFGLVIEMAVLR